MQTRSRANGSSYGHGKSRKSETSGYSKASACLWQIGLILLVSCATPGLRKSPDKLSTQFKNLCLSGEGHGRISFLSGRYRFDYESITYPKKKEWALAFHYPGVGEKLVRLDYGKALKGPYSDDYLDKFLVEIKDEKSSRNYRGVLKEFFHRLALVIKTREDFRDGDKSIWLCRKGSCAYKNIKMNWKLKGGKLFLKFPLSEDYIFHVEAFSKDRYYNHMRIFVQKEKDIGIKRNPIELMLFLNACYQK